MVRLFFVLFLRSGNNKKQTPTKPFGTSRLIVLFLDEKVYFFFSLNNKYCESICTQYRIDHTVQLNLSLSIIFVFLRGKAALRLFAYMSRPLEARASPRPNKFIRARQTLNRLSVLLASIPASSIFALVLLIHVAVCFHPFTLPRV